MSKIRIEHSYKVYLPLAILFLTLVLIFPRMGKFNYDYRKGSPWMYETLIAQFDFPVLKTDAQIQAEKELLGSSVIPYFRYSDQVGHTQIGLVEKLDLGKANSFKPEIINAFDRLYGSGILAESGSGYLPEGKSLDGNVIFVQKDRRARKVPSSEVYTVEEARDFLLLFLTETNLGCNVDSLCRAAGLYDLVQPNLLFDRQTTDLVHEESVDYVSPTSGVVNAGQLIVSNGEIITAEIEQLLDSYKAEYESSLGYSGPRVWLWLGNILIALGLVVVLFFALYFTNYRIYGDSNKYIYLLVIFLLATVLALVVDKVDPALLYMTPFTLIALYLVAFFKKRVVLPVYIISLLPLLIFSHNGVELFVMFLVAGVVTIFLAEIYNRGWKQFITAVAVFFIMLLVYLGFRLIDGISGFNDFRTILFLFIGAFLSVAGYPLIYLFERIFMLVSNTRLTELTDTNNRLLRDLAHKAPGTFQHSLQVMNLADAAARSIDANVLLVRAGALYHDIGKMVNPQCFIENETLGARYHDGLTPRESAMEIVKHVPDGMALADKAKLPGIVKDFIVTHHGTTCTAYFYNKYLKEGGDPSDAGDFYYKGVKPTSKEQIIVMLCDTLEAASRTLKDYSSKTVSDLVERIVKSKMDDGQFENADISIKELNIVKNVLKGYLQQIYHARITYPKRP
ncbi:MAG: HDIG domain-containing protein [Bacteroidetes bacterium]|uniref:HDIG domain-containing protein n=1 Tax=Candidatus Cryptobacteroides merdigallinarum TaxID=2840770 RepID=A0A9D9EJG5_9BACT|nr:HDIG domain-containing protein [Candidatus Cryptobacteroides merdigallinarum]